MLLSISALFASNTSKDEKFIPIDFQLPLPGWFCNTGSFWTISWNRCCFSEITVMN